MSGQPSEVERLLAEVRAHEERGEVPESLFWPPRLLEAVIADLAGAPASLARDDEALVACAAELAGEEAQGAEVWVEIAIRLARLLATESEADIDDELDRLLALVRATRSVAEKGAGGVSPELVEAAPEGTNLREVLRFLESRVGEPAVAFLALLALHLGGHNPKARRSVSTSVVLVSESAFVTKGMTAKLTVEEVRQGPGGAVPDPATMLGLRSASGDLAEAVERARRQVDPGGFRSFRWSVTSDEPVLTIDGPSLAAGWAVAGLELNDRARHRPRLRALSARIAVTGDVDPGGGLVPVDHLDRKASAAQADRRAGLVYPEDTDEDLSGYGSSDFTLIPAADVAEAHQRARKSYDRSLAVLGAACVVVATLLVVGFIWYRNTEDQRQADARVAQAKDLLIEATQLRSSDLRASLLTAYESNLLDPTSEARDLITKGVGEGSSLRRVLTTESEAVAVEALRPLGEDSSWQGVVLDERGVVTVSDLETGELLASLRPQAGEPYQAVAANPLVPWIVVATENAVQQELAPSYDALAGAPALQPASCPGADVPLLAVSADGSKIAATRGSEVCVWDARTGERVAGFTPRDLPTADGEEAAAIASVTAIAFGSTADSLYLGRSGGFEEVDLTTWERRSIEVDPGLNVVSLAAYRSLGEDADTVLVATQGGLFAQFLSADAPTRLPVSADQVGGIEANVDGSVVVAVYAEEVVRLDPDDGFAAAVGEEASSAPLQAGVRADVALIDQFDTQLVATLGGAQAVVLGKRTPAQQWASIDMGADHGIAINSDASRVIHFGESSATGYELTPGVRNEVQTYGAGTSLDLPRELGDGELRIRDAFFTSGADERLIVYGYSVVGREDPAVALVRVFDGRTFEPERDLLVPSGVQRQISTVLEVDDELLVVDVQGRVSSFDIDTGEPGRTAELGVELPIDAAVDPDREILAVAWSVLGADGTVVSPPEGNLSFFHYPSLEPVGPPNLAPGQAVWNIEFLDPATVLVHGADDRMYELHRHEGADGSQLWQAREPVTMAGDRQESSWFQVSPARDRVLVVVDGDVMVFPTSQWDTPEIVQSGGDAEVGLAAFVPNGDGAAVLTEEALELWSWPSDDLLDRICAVVGTGFSEDEWAEHIGDVPHVARCPERTADPTVDVTAEVVEDPSFGAPSEAEPVTASTSSCDDFEELAPDRCITYGDDDSPYALVLTSESDVGSMNVLTQWAHSDGQWQATVEYPSYTEPEDIQRIDLEDVPSQAAVITFPGSYAELVVFDGEEVVLREFGGGGSLLAIPDLYVRESVSRGEQSMAEAAARQIGYRWERDGWAASSVAPGTTWGIDTDVLFPDGLAGVDLGGSFTDAVAAVDDALNLTTDRVDQRSTTEWSDGLSETATESWTEREPIDLTEVCWYGQLCAYGDDDGRLFGWRYDAGRTRPGGTGAASSADRLGLTTEQGVGLGTPIASVDLEAMGWPERSLTSNGGLNRFLIGAVHPKGAIATLPAPRSMTNVPELAGADLEKSQDLTLAEGRIHLTVDASLNFRWELIDGTVAFSQWIGRGPVGIGVYDDEGELAAAGSLPGPAESDWTLDVCEKEGGVVATATGPGGLRSWTVTPTGLAWIETPVSC